MPAANLRPLAFDDIQLLRYWRNLDHVRRRMVFQEIIGRDQQRKWFNELNNDRVNYFIYSLDDNDIGSVHLTTLDSHEKTFEAGIFCGDPDFLRHWINMWACIRLYNYAFLELGFETAYATIRKDNTSAHSLNRSLGYVSLSEETEGATRLTLTKDNYVQESQKLQRYLREFAKQDI
ncbi:MAG: GNAT family N-acetyltransferase [Rubripirellula sp.]